MSTAHAVKCVLHTRSWSSLLPAPPRLYSHTLKFSGTLISTGCFSETREPWSWGPKKHVIQKTRVDEGFYARTQNTQHTYTQVHTHTYTEVHTHAHTVDWSSQPIPFPQFTALGKSDFLNFTYENENVLRCLFCFEVFKNNSAWKIVFSCSHFFFLLEVTCHHVNLDKDVDEPSATTEPALWEQGRAKIDGKGKRNPE